MQLEQEAKEWIKKKEGVKPPKKFGKYRMLLVHFYILYSFIFILFILNKCEI